VLKRATWYIEEDLLYKMKRLALDKRTTLTAIANQAFSEYLNNQDSTNQVVTDKEVKTFAKDLHTHLEKTKKARK
jgi:hypothetical protein